MVYVNNLLFGFAMASIGVTLPGLVNMTAVSVTVKRGINAGLRFSIGASAMIFFQVLLAVTFAGWLTAHSAIFSSLKKLGILVFLIMGIIFFMKGRMTTLKENKTREGHGFWLGVIITGMNVLNIPFYFGASTFLEANALIDLKHSSGLFFTTGATLGALLFLTAYAFFSRYIANRAQNFARNVYFITSTFFFFLAVVQMLDVYFSE